MNKKSIIGITIGIILVVLLATYITLNATSYEVGQTVNLGYGRPDATMTDKDGNAVPNLMNSSYFNYFCAKRGAKVMDFNSITTYYNVANVVITGNTATLSAEIQDSSEVYTETFTESETNANKALALLFYKIKNVDVEVNELDIDIGYTYDEETEKWGYWKVTSTKTGNRIVLTRDRLGISGFPAFGNDFGQYAMWRTLKDWQKNVAINMDKEEQAQSLWKNLASYLQSTDISKYEKSAYQNNITQAATAFAYGEELYSEVVDEVSQVGIENQYGIEESYYKNSSPDKELETRIDNEGTTILGPFQYNFVGKIQNEKPTLTFNQDTTPQEYIIGTYEGSEFVETNKIISGNKFYIKIATDLLANASNIHLNFQIEGISLDNTTTTINFLVRYKNSGAWQPIMHIEQEEGHNEPFKDSYKISKSVEVTLEKKGENGEDLKAEGIKFQIKDETNAVVAYIVTDANGNGIITDSEGKATGETNVTLLTGQTYTLIETENNVYGYKKCILSVEDIEFEGAQIEQSGNNIKFKLNADCSDKLTIKVKNQKELANVAIEKVGENETKLEDVEFVIQIGSSKYIQLKDSQEQIVTVIKGEATINTDNKANSTEYHIEYVEDISKATKFVTDANGKITIKNLEMNKSKTEKYTYTACEVSNPNYGYGSGANTKLRATATELVLNQITSIKITNQIDLGNLQLEKQDENRKDLKLENVGFAIEISPAPENKYAYVALYNKEGKIVTSIKGTSTINRKNIANENEYEVRYYCTDKTISELSEQERDNLEANITTFVTDSNGTFTVNNLEVYSPKTNEKYVYKLIETSNSNYGYIADSVELGDIILEVGETANNVLGNEQKYTKLSGYVWIENSAEKSNNYDGVYTEGDLSNDIKLTDLYINKDDSGLVKNPEAVTPVEIKLRDKTTGEFIKAQPDEFDSNGKYTFVDVEVEKLSNYEVVFIYNGFYYSTVVEHIDKDNGSKVKENATERESLNNKFTTVKNNKEVVAADGTTNTVEYYKEGHTSIVSKLNFDATLSANTTSAGYNLRDAFNAIKTSGTTLTEELENINMGIVLREQPKISINNDIHSVLVEFEGYKYNYEYNGRQNYYENKNGDDIGVKFEQENTEKRYTRTVYSSDIQAAKDQNKEIKVSVTYKMQVANQSRTLGVMPKQLINYFDARYEIKAVGLGLDKETHTITDALTFSDVQLVEGHPEYKSAVIDFNQTIEAGNSNVKSIYITFDIQRDAILDLLNQKSTYHNAVEVLSYSSYYGAETSKVDGVQFTTDQTEAGKIYAGIDKISEPGNMEIVLVDHPSGDGTKILDTTNFEDDTSSAPSLLLEAGEAREISGTIWEDIATNTADNQKLGDGIYDQEKEKPIQNVTIELHRVDNNGNIEEAIATYSNGEPAKTVTNEQGKYTFGYYDQNNKKYVGVLPGKYVIEYNYDGTSYIVGGKNINPNEYKSTIIASQVIENAFKGQNQRWYLVEEGHRYSDARDNIYLRPEYNSETDADITVTNSTYQNELVINNMEAHTPIMDIGIEFTENDTGNALELEFIKELQNIDFGIIERPDIDITLEKQITGLEIISQTGTTIIPKGDPSNPNESMQYVKTGLDGLVSAEIDPKLLQGATLKLEYTITVVNNSDKDYLEEDYYYYGRNGITETTSKVKLVADYLDSTMVLDETQNNESWEVRVVEDLYDTESNKGLINEEVYNELKAGKYHILTTNAFEDVGNGNEKTVKLYASKALAVSDSITEENHVEILELTGNRTIKESIPGNYNPAKDGPGESDNDKVELIVTPPTGTTVNYIVYVIAIMATFAIIVLGIVIIKKKIIK